MLNFYILNLYTLSMKKITVFVAVLLLLACNNKTKENKTSTEIKTKNSSEKQDSEFGIFNYAIVWEWTTTDKQLVNNNTVKISNELTELWKKGAVENVYYNSDAKVDKLDYFPNISFFLKAKSKVEAEKILNNLTVVKKGIANYTIYPVGVKWLGRKSEKIKIKGITNSYVSVWNTVTKDNQVDSEEIIEKYVKSQSDATLRLWNEGTIENVYFDIEGTQSSNNITDFVFFVNANSENEAKKICDELPFAKNKLASYKLLSVGIFWLGEFQNN